MNRETAVTLLDRLHQAQNEFYADGSDAELRERLMPSITRTVPGTSPIAGTYRGINDVFAYFRRRRDLAQRTFRIKQRDVLVGAGNRIAALNDGGATVDGVDHHWSTVGFYEVTGARLVGEEGFGDAGPRD